MNRTRSMFAHAKRVGGGTTHFALPSGRDVATQLRVIPTQIRPIQLQPLPRLRHDQIAFIREMYAMHAGFGAMFREDLEECIEEALLSHS